MGNTLRDKIRAATVAQPKKYNSETVEMNGIELEVRQLGIDVRGEYMKSCMDEKGEIDMVKLQVNAIILACYVPGTDETVFEDTDYEAISKSVAGGYADKIWETFQKLSNLSVDDAKKN